EDVGNSARAQHFLTQRQNHFLLAHRTVNVRVAMTSTRVLQQAFGVEYLTARVEMHMHEAIPRIRVILIVDLFLRAYFDTIRRNGLYHRGEYVEVDAHVIVDVDADGLLHRLRCQRRTAAGICIGITDEIGVVDAISRVTGYIDIEVARYREDTDRFPHRIDAGNHDGIGVVG